MKKGFYQELNAKVTIKTWNGLVHVQIVFTLKDKDEELFTSGKAVTYTLEPYG